MNQPSRLPVQRDATDRGWTLGQRIRFYWKLVGALGFRGFVDRGLAKRYGRAIHTPLSKYPVSVRRGSSDVLVFDQIFVDREYRCIEGLSGIKTIVDAGANVGYSSAYFLSNFPDATVVALEPDPENFMALERNLSPWGDRVTCLRAALWSEPTMLNFRCETLHEGAEWGRQVEPSRSGDVEALDIPSILGRLGWKSVDLLKVDIEGAEREVFASPNWLRRVENIVIELHGPNEEQVFFDAIRCVNYTISRCDELTVCLS